MTVPATPRIVGRYAIFDEIASGGMATVYLGRLMGAGGFARTVAIKRLHPQFARDPEFVAMFLDEARLAARIRHPNVVPTLDVVASKGELFLVMEYIQGESLSRLARALRAKGERVPIPILLRIIGDALQGLHAAHEARDERGLSLEIVHRDVTPQNVLVGVDGVGRLLDFGVAKAAGRAHTTRDGQIKGKLGYMAPEQLMGSGVTRQTDVYAASVVLWEMLAGERLFSGGSEVDVIAKLLKRDVKPPSAYAPEVPAALDEVVMRGLAADVKERFATARDLCIALGGCGLQESAGIVVAEWVAGLATQALAERSAKIAAIETQTDTSIQILAPHASTPPHASHSEAKPHSATVETLPPGAAASEAGAEDSNVTINATAIQRKVRVRVLGVGMAIVAGVMAVIFAFVRFGAAPERAHAVPASPSSVASPASSPSLIPAPPPIDTSPPVAPALASSESAAAPTQTPRPSGLRAVAPALQRATPAGAKPPRPTPPSAHSASGYVFDQRE